MTTGEAKDYLSLKLYTLMADMDFEKSGREWWKQGVRIDAYIHFGNVMIWGGHYMKHPFAFHASSMGGRNSSGVEIGEFSELEDIQVEVLDDRWYAVKWRVENAVTEVFDATVESQPLWIRRQWA